MSSRHFAFKKVKIENAVGLTLAHGGLCLGCNTCRYPKCSFGK